HAMFFFAPAPRSLGEASCIRLKLSAESAGGAMRLAISFPGGSAADRGLLNPVQDIAFAYLGASGWQTEWASQTDLPLLVRVRLRFPRGDPHIWPELYVRPRISAENDCTYSSVTKTCQGS